MAGNIVAWVTLFILWCSIPVGIVIGIALLIQFLATVMGISRLFGRGSQPTRAR